MDRGCPAELRRRAYQSLMLGIRQQGILRGERLPDLVARVCPSVLSFVALEGYRADLDLPENTHEALCRGVIAMELRRLPAA